MLNGNDFGSMVVALPKSKDLDVRTGEGNKDDVEEMVAEVVVVVVIVVGVVVVVKVVPMIANFWVTSVWKSVTGTVVVTVTVVDNVVVVGFTISLGHSSTEIAITYSKWFLE